MSSPHCVYAGHSYHRQTSSTKFLLDILEKNYRLSVLWDDSWQPGKAPITAAQINDLRPDIVVFFQTLPSRSELKRIRCNRLFLVPMHDFIVGNPKNIWRALRFSRLRVLNFCRATHDFFAQLGYETRCVQYWQPKRRESVENDGLSIFFWPRVREIGWPTLRALLGSARPKKIVIRASADPGQEIALPTPQECAEYNIEVVHGWLEKDRYLQLLTSCSVFVAPRLFEGIGQSFIEAMSYGLAVIAPNNPTMNEYIRHERSGYLYHPANPTSLDFSNLQDVRTQALADVERGHDNWQKQESLILEYLGSEPSRKLRFKWFLGRLLRKHKW